MHQAPCFSNKQLPPLLRALSRLAGSNSFHWSGELDVFEFLQMFFNSLVEEALSVTCQSEFVSCGVSCDKVRPNSR